jgi:ABC-type cobalamin/Fe3+-siderophores transport system ATPase subunit
MKVEENNNELFRGSVWKKWDLHIHTPASFFWKGGKQLKDMTSEEKTVEIKKFISTVNESDISVFCLMDYWTFDWYLELQEYVKENPNSLKKTVFPGMELRIECPVDYRLNIHCILSDKLSKQELIDFKSELYIRSIDKKLSNDALIKFADSLDKSKARIHGFDDPKTLSKDKLIELGSKTAEITKESLTKAFKQIPIDTGFVILPYDTSDGLQGLDWSSHPQDDNYFMQTAHIFETRKQSNIDVISGKKTNENESYFDNFFKTLGNKPKPCISGSDAHTYSKYGCFPSNRITWVKANPTFEGLKQIIYEPEDRVKIQELCPDDKEDYQIIDKVKFIDNDFLTSEILINQNLTAIIGGKSTGKSVLLRNIAHSIDPTEVKNRLNEVGLDLYQKEVSDFRVIWKDSQENKKNDSSDINKKIIYIPQSYLNRLVDKKEGKTSIDDIIKNVLDQDSDIRTVFNDLDFSKRVIEKNITKNIEDLFYVSNDIKNLSENIKKIGDKKGINSEVEKLKVIITDLQNKSGMEQESVNNYNELNKEKENLKNRKNSYNKDISILNEIKSNTYFNQVNFEDLSSDLKKSLENSFSLISEKYLIEWNKELEIKISFLMKECERINKEIEQNNKLLQPLVNIIVESKSLDEKVKKLTLEECKLKSIILEEEKLFKLKNYYQELIKEISLNHSKFYEELFDSRAKIIKQTIIIDDLEFNIDINFQENSFKNNFIDEVCNLRNINQFNEGFLNYYIFSSNEKFKGDIENIIIGILNEKLTLKNSYSKKEAITRLVRNWFYFDYIIKQNGDKISEMSPGKKSFVLLKLLIELDNSKCPILLDQPEDDLDNRSIYNDLVKFIKSKKKDRQIIIATHNPNLVVGADAECIIVANQRGSKTEEAQIFKFEYIGGSLENSFVKPKVNEVLYKQGVQEHVCDILEGGKRAFEQRREKYSLT